MPADLLKFRCYRCNQLLAVSPSKVGAIVACPKCKADLVVPGAETPTKGEPRPRTKVPDAVEPGSSDPLSKSPSPNFLGEPYTEIPPDVADLRPEDLRVEAAFFAQPDAQAAGSKPSTRLERSRTSIVKLCTSSSDSARRTPRSPALCARPRCFPSRPSQWS